MSLPISDLLTPEPGGTDYTWAGPLHECPCGCDLFHILAKFEDGQVVFYFTDAICSSCSSTLRAPTEIDEESNHDRWHDPDSGPGDRA